MRLCMGWGNTFRSRTRKAVRMALNDLGKRGVTYIRQVIGVRVQYVGSYVVRSDPGEPPRREHSKLWRAVKYYVAPKAEGLEHLVIYISEDDPRTIMVAGFLEHGTSIMEPRPFWKKSGDQIRRWVRSEFRILVANNLGTAPFRDFGAGDQPAGD